MLGDAFFASAISRGFPSAASAPAKSRGCDCRRASVSSCDERAGALRRLQRGPARLDDLVEDRLGSGRGHALHLRRPPRPALCRAAARGRSARPAASGHCRRRSTRRRGRRPRAGRSRGRRRRARRPRSAGRLGGRRRSSPRGSRGGAAAFSARRPATRARRGPRRTRPASSGAMV